MEPIDLDAVCEALGPQLRLRPPAGSIAVNTISTDTRQMRPGSLFIAIRGEHMDGHAYLAQAADEGAVAAIVDAVPTGAPAGLVLLPVWDTRIAMGRLATVLRRRLKGKVIAVAGSNGKTSTKFLIDAVLRSRLRGSMSPRSFNNDIGVPLAIFPAESAQDYLVLEMGTNHPGEIRVLTEMAEPDIAVITNCGLEHLEGLGDLAGVRRENAEMIHGLPARGTLIINGDDAELLAAVTGFPGKRITFGTAEGNDLRVRKVRCRREGTAFAIAGNDRDWFVPMLGRHAAVNSAAAIAVGRIMGLTDAQIAEALATARGPDMRLQMTDLAGGVTLVNDAYNANPSSMQAALDTLVNLPSSGRRVAILGDMRELGHQSAMHHRTIGTAAALGGRIDRLVCVGPDAAHIADAAIEAGMPKIAVERYADAPAAAAAVTALVREGDLVLLKASRAVKLEMVEAALAAFAGAWEKGPPMAQGARPSMDTPAGGIIPTPA